MPVFYDGTPPSRPDLNAPWPQDNLGRAGLAARLGLAGETERALEVVSEDRQGFGSSLIAINRLYLGEALAAARHFAAQRGREPSGIKSFTPARVDSPLVSVIMPTYNRASAILPSARSVLEQDFESFELVAVNDGGDPAVMDALAALGSPRVALVDAEHKGLAGALNLGLAKSRGKYIARLDDDDLYFPHHLKTAATFLESRPEVAAVYTDHRAIRQSKQGGEYVTIEDKEMKAPDWDLAEYRRRNFFTPANVVLRKDALSEVGPYNEYFPTREDWELYLRVGGVFGFTHVPETTCAYFMRTDQSNLTNYDRRGFIHYANLAGYIHRFYAVTGSLWLEEGLTDRRVKKVIRALDAVLAVCPEAITLAYLKKLDLLSRKKPYTFFMEWARNLAAHPDFQGVARLVLEEAVRLNPFEPGPRRELRRLKQESD